MFKGVLGGKVILVVILFEKGHDLNTINVNYPMIQNVIFGFFTKL